MTRISRRPAAAAFCALLVATSATVAHGPAHATAENAAKTDAVSATASSAEAGANAAPTLGTVTPAASASAPGVARSFSAVYSDADGYADVKYAWFLVNATLSVADGIWLLYDRTVDRLYLYNDAGTGYAGSCAPGTAGSVSNAHGTLNCAATTVSGAGDDLTVVWNITPGAGFASATKKNLYLYARDMSNANVGWADRGDWTMRGADAAPTLGTVTPAASTSAPGVARSFSAVYSGADGYADVKYAWFLVNATLSVADGIWLLYDRTVDRLYLYNDAGTGYAGSCAPGMAGSVSNAHGTLNCAATTVSGAGDDLTVVWNITPGAGFASTTKKNLYLYARDMSNANVGWADRGDWTIAGANAAPTLGTVTPAASASAPGVARSFSAVYSDADGYADVKYAWFLVNPTLSVADGIWLLYDRTVDRLCLYNDAGTGYAGSCAPGTAGSLSNAHGTLNCAATTVSGAGDDLTVVWNITPGAGFASATKKNFYLYARDMSNANVGWADRGDWTIDPAAAPTDCVGCHNGNPEYPLAPNVMGDGSDPDGTGAIPKAFDDGTWGYTVNGHGANGTASNTPKQMIDPGPPPLYSPYLTPDLECTDCHDISLPSTGSGRHLNGVLNSVEQKLNPSENTAHLRTDGAYPFIAASPSNDWDVQIAFDQACWGRCHQSIYGLSDMRHGRSLVASWDNVNTTPDAVRFGDRSTEPDGEAVAYPIDSALTTKASTAGDDFAPCISCHEPHGTATVEPGRETNRMLRDAWMGVGTTFCYVCHL